MPTTTAMLSPPLAMGIPNPIGWGWDRLNGWAADIGESLFTDMMTAFARWMLEGAIEASNIVWGLATQGTDLNIMDQADTYATTQSIAAVFFVGVLWWAIGAAALKGDPGLIARRLLLDAPKVVLGSTAMLAVLNVVNEAFEEIELLVIDRIGAGEGPFAGFDVAALDQGSELSLVASVLVPFIAFFMILVSLALSLFLMIRFAAVNLLVVFVPLAMVAQMTPYSSMARLILEKLVALFISKTVILIALGVSATLIGNIPEDGNVYFTSPAPAAPSEPLEEVDEEALEAERLAADGNAWRIIGTQLGGLGVMLVAAFSPMVVFNLIPSAYHDTSPYSGGDVGGLYGSTGPGSGGFSSARRAGGRPAQTLRRVRTRGRGH